MWMYNGASWWGQAFNHWLYKGVTFVFLLSFPLSLPFDWTLRCWVCVCCFVLLYFGCYVVLCVKKKKKLLITKKKLNVKAPVFKIFGILKSLLTSAIKLSDNGSFFKHSFLIYLVPQYLLILFYLNCVFFPPSFYIKVYAVRASKLS